MEQIEHAFHRASRPFENHLDATVRKIAHRTRQTGVAGVADHERAKADNLDPPVHDRPCAHVISIHRRPIICGVSPGSGDGGRLQ